MHPKIQNLANLIRDRRRQGPKFVLMLGAGASISSGVKRTPEIMEELVSKYGNGLTGKIEDKFDVVWKGMNPADREAFLKPLLSHTPAVGYSKLAALVEAGYFDVALSFNFDNLVEKALDAIGFSDFRRVIRGETIDSEMEKLIEKDEPRFRLVKLHGSLTSTERFFFDVNEMTEYPAPIHALLDKLTRQDLIICGYAFNDVCVLRSFAKSGGPIWCVNPAGVPRGLKGFLKDRGSDDQSIELGFDEFFDELHGELLAPPPPPPGGTPPNPFKFLEGYEEEERKSFIGRDDEVALFSEALASAAGRIIVVAGPAKAGKTSLVRAGLIPALHEDKHISVYVRCHEDLDRALPRALWPDDPATETMTVRASLERLGKLSETKRIVLFLDQFERATSGFELTSKEGEAAFAKFLNGQLIGASDNVTPVLVVVDDPTLVRTLYPTLANKNMLHIVPCPAFERGDVANIIQALASQAGFEIPPTIIEDMLDKYEKGKNSVAPDRCTLAHVQALCHIVAAARTTDFDRYRRELDNTLRALHHAISVCDFISYVEDLSWSEAAWFRSMVKVPLKESKATIAEFITLHWKELVPPPGSARTLRNTLDARNAGRTG